MKDSVHVKGLSDLAKFLDELAPKLQKNIMRGALRAGMKEVLPAAKANIHSVSGQLAKGLKLSTNSRGSMVTASIKAKGPHGYLARFIEYGTRAHVINARAGGALEINGRLVKAVNHPGIQPKPFMRPALDTRAQAAVVAAGNYVKDRLATKHGLDTTAVNVEAETDQ